jgi:hypothetical protein
MSDMRSPVGDGGGARARTAGGREGDGSVMSTALVPIGECFTVAMTPVSPAQPMICAPRWWRC